MPNWMRDWFRDDDGVFDVAEFLMLILGVLAAMGLVLSLVVGFTASVPKSATCALFFGLSFAAGGFMGLVMGFPRFKAASRDGRPVDSADQLDRVAEEPPTVLEEMADTLTKLLLGAGLAQFEVIDHKITRLVVFVGRELESGKGAPPAVSGKLLAFCIFGYAVMVGFLTGHFFAKFYLKGVLVRAGDRIALRKQLNSMTAARESDLEAIGLIRDLCTPDASKQVDTARLAAQLKNASDVLRNYTLVSLENLRKSVKRNAVLIPRYADFMQLARALVGTQHWEGEARLHAELGKYAMAQQTPDWSVAEKSFATAIDRRGKQGLSGFDTYELYYAKALLMRSGGPKAAVPAETTAVIDDALRKVAKSEAVHRLPEHPELKEWLELRKAKIDGITG